MSTNFKAFQHFKIRRAWTFKLKKKIQSCAESALAMSKLQKSKKEGESQ